MLDCNSEVKDNFEVKGNFEDYSFVDNFGDYNLVDTQGKGLVDNTLERTADNMDKDSQLDIVDTVD